jgi:anti-sigma B factor antagonist
MPTIKIGADQDDSSIRRVFVEGEIDVSLTAELQARLAEASLDPRSVVIVDLSECLFIDSRGLSTLLNAQRRLTRSGGSLAVVCPNPTPLRVFQITHTDDTLNVALTDDEARELALGWRERLSVADENDSGDG